MKILRQLCWYGCLILIACACNAHAAKIDVEIAFIGDTAGNAYKGVVQGIDEANRQGRFLGQSYTMRAVSSLSEAPDAAAVLVAGDARKISAVAGAASDHAVFNLLATGDGLRDACLDNLINVMPSDAMKADALAQWRQAGKDGKPVAQAWHHSFKKYAAAQLNSRYEKAQGQLMDDEAWAGWAGARIIADAVARTKSSEPSTLLQFIRNELAFDGQKGINMSVRDTGQLRQPLLLVENDKILGEAPVRGVSPGGLDSLGMTDCGK